MSKKWKRVLLKIEKSIFIFCFFLFVWLFLVFCFTFILVDNGFFLTSGSLASVREDRVNTREYSPRAANR